MQDTKKTKKQLIEELTELRKKVTGLEAAAVERHLTEETQERVLVIEREKRAMSEALHWAGAVLSSTLNFERVLDHMMEQIGRVIPYTAACIMLTEGKKFRIFRWRGYNQFETAGMPITSPLNIADVPTLQTIQKTGWPLAVPYVNDDNEWIAITRQNWIKSSVSVPIRTRNRLVGFLHVDSDVLGIYSQIDAERLQAFANQAGIALENARRYDQARAEIARRVKALKKERDFVSAILDTTSTLVVALDLNGNIVRFNAACEYMTGYTFDEVKGENLWDMFLSAEEAKIQKNTFEQIKQGQYPVSCECHWLAKDGRQRLVSWVNTALTDNKGAVEYIVGTGIDITEQRQTEIERQNLIEDLEAFAYTVAHDLQHTVGVSIGFADGLLNYYSTMSPEEVGEYLQHIVHSNQKMSNIIDELLLLAGVRKHKITPKPLNMAAIVSEALQRLSYMIDEYKAEITLSNDWSVALGHPPWVEEVWTNYISNAVKHGGRPPHVELGSSVQPDGMVTYWVRDNGPGISTRQQAALFKPFTRLEQVQVKGHGLGLSIVRRIVEKLNGRVGVESKVGQGTVFSFTLPEADIGHSHE